MTDKQEVKAGSTQYAQDIQDLAQSIGLSITLDDRRLKELAQAQADGTLPEQLLRIIAAVTAFSGSLQK